MTVTSGSPGSSRSCVKVRFSSIGITAGQIGNDPFPPRLGRSPTPLRMAAEGQDDQFPPRRPNAHYRFR